MSVSHAQLKAFHAVAVFARECREATHEGAADAEDVEFHARKPVT